ncbi:MAG: type II toxin-antitoxin system RelE/ParE family toxin [Gemmataceae bacterium]|nr:type II toxin-antitoxin system RelE/ParE family toxin [Gemmataceae bacterium]
MPPIDEWPTFVHTRVFDAAWEAAGLGDEDLARLQAELTTDPQAGDPIVGTGGVRKYRFARPGRGRSGGVRVLYARYPDAGVVLLALVYAKGQADDISPAGRKRVAALVAAFGRVLAGRQGG